MKKVIILSCITIISTLFSTNVAASDQPEIEGNINYSVGDEVFSFTRYDITSDFEGNLALVLCFEYTNNSSEPNMAASDFYVQVFQNGIEKDTCILSSDSQWETLSKNLVTDIKDGVTLPVCRSFVLDDLTSPIDIETSELVNFSDSQKMSIDIAQYSGSVPETESTLSGETDDYEVLKEKYEALQSDYETLQSEYSELQEQYNHLLENNDSALSTNPDPAIETEATYQITSEMLQESLYGIAKNSNDCLDKIISIAENDIDSVTEGQINEAISAIKDNYPNYYDDSETMELYMYYGYLLDFAFADSDPRSELGMDTYQAIKYVYRNVDSVSDSSTQSNLNQIQKDLQHINF